MNHVHLCPACHAREACDLDCSIEPDLRLGDGTESGSHSLCSRCAIIAIFYGIANAETEKDLEEPERLLLQEVQLSREELIAYDLAVARVRSRWAHNEAMYSGIGSHYIAGVRIDAMPQGEKQDKG